MADVIELLCEAERAATKGPWIADKHFAERVGGRTYLPIIRPGDDLVPIAVVHRDVDGYGREEGETNARLIALARTHMPALLTLVNAARRVCDSIPPAEHHESLGDLASALAALGVHTKDDTDG